MKDERIKPGQEHERVGAYDFHDTYPEDADDPRPAGGYPNKTGQDFTPAPITRAADEGSAAKLRQERRSRHGEGGGYSTPGYGKVRTAPSQR